MGEQLELFKDMSDKNRKPRLTLKAKQKAVDELLDLVMNGWDPSEEVWRLIDWLSYDIREAGAKGK